MTSPTIFREVQAVCFDCFGTLMSVIEGPGAYRKLVGTAPNRSAMRHQVLTQPQSFEQHAHARGWPLSAIAAGRMALNDELASIQVFDDAYAVLTALRAKGLKIALCSNLAMEFGPAALKALPFLFDSTVLSFEVGQVKPDPAIFDMVCSSLACAPGQVLMVGDSARADIEGARAAGMLALQINRAVPRTTLTISELTQLLEIF